MSVAGVLLIIFIVLKVLEIITFSWWWVFAPLWIPLGFYIGAYLLAIVAEMKSGV